MHGPASALQAVAWATVYVYYIYSWKDLAVHYEQVVEGVKSAK